MIVADKPLNLETSPDIKPSNFRIKASKKAFEILSAGLYSDKVKAIIRELSTNAMDSHVAAGKANEPFEIHLPNNMEPHFSVRDNGVGLSPVQISTIYTTYFESDKTNTNSMTGCLGLGSKSPFSYTDQFTVESRFDGIKTTYTAHMDADGLPAIAKLGECPTTECNGVEIKFAVKPDDFYEFQRKASDVLRWFVVLPTVKGVRDFELEPREYMRKTEKYGLSKSRIYDKSCVVMGNVAYQVSAGDIRSANVQLTELERKVLEWGCDLFVPIGALDITANREKVSYDPTSVAALKDCLVSAVEDIKQEVENIITNAPTLWQARKALHDAQHSILGQVRNLMDVTWKGQKITSFINVKKSSTPPECQCLKQRNTKFKKSFTDTIHADNIPVVINDLQHGGYVRVINWLNENQHQECYLLSGVQQPFLDETGIEEVAVRTSKLPKPERGARAAVPRRPGMVKAKLNQFKEECRSNVCADYWKPADVDLSEGGIYVEITYFRYKKTNSGEETSHPQDLRRVVELFRQLGYEEKIYGIRPGDVKALDKHEGWVSLDAFVEAVLDENDDLIDKVQMIEQWNNLSNSGHTSCFFKHISELDQQSLFGQFLVKAKKANESVNDEKAKAYSALTTLTNRVLPENTHAGDLDGLRDKVYNKYPLLQYIDWYRTERDGMKQSVIAYVKALDAV